MASKSVKIRWSDLRSLPKDYMLICTLLYFQVSEMTLPRSGLRRTVCQPIGMQGNIARAETSLLVTVLRQREPFFNRRLGRESPLEPLRRKIPVNERASVVRAQPFSDAPPLQAATA